MGPDPYRYFRPEAREIHEALTRGVLALERGAAADTLNAMLRQAHNLKGAARVVRQPEIAELAHAVEDVLEPYRAGAGPLPRERIDQLLSLLDRLAERLRALERPAEAPGEAARSEPPAAVEGPAETVRVHIEELDQLLRHLAEVTAVLADLRGQAGSLARARRLARAVADQRALRRTGDAALGASPRTLALGDELRATLDRGVLRLELALERAEHAAERASVCAHALRLVPVSRVLSTLERAARDAAAALGRRVEFVASSGDVRVDGEVLAALEGPLLHLVRNAVDHGIEPPEARRAAGKREDGRVELRVERRGAHAVFTCRDDGRGVDVAAVARAARARGLVPPDADPGADEAVRLAFGGGLSSRTAVTAVSGRGVGIDAVRAALARLHGEVDIESVPGEGTRVVLTVPLSLSSSVVLEVEAASVTAFVPLDAVRRVLRLTSGDVACAAGAETVLVDGEALPFARLDALFGEPAARAAGASSALLVAAGAERAVVGVDRILGTREVVVHPVPALCGEVPLVAGTSIDATSDGVERPRLVLEPRGLVRAAARSSAAEEAVPAAPARVLVIDDSLTTRMLEKSILETAGYEVDVASSGEEGLSKAQAGRYALVLVDVEMPGMDGFGFTERVRRDPDLRDTPILMVTSLASPAHKARAAALGVQGYIVKSEFDQGLLLERIAELVR